jgi:hypothetical protein
MADQQDQLEALAAMLSKEMSIKPVEEQKQWFSQVSAKKNIVKYLMKLISSDDSKVSTSQHKLSIVCLDMIIELVVGWQDDVSDHQTLLLDQLVSVENFWTSVYKTAASTESGATCRCHCFRMMLNAYNLSRTSIPQRIFSDQIIVSVFDVLANHQSSSISRNRQNLQIILEYLLALFAKHPERFQKHLSGETPLIEICAQTIVAGGGDSIITNPRINFQTLKSLAESLVANSNNVYTPLALMIF